MTSRERRSWTEVEDNLLRFAIQKEDTDSHPPTKWRAIAKHVPNRNNKDCRKRWFAKMSSPVARGGWSADEDDRLITAIQKYGTRWSLVSASVGTRNNNQCAKRWGDTLSPDIDKTPWTPEEDARLLAAVRKHGTLWAQIVKFYFPGRTGLSAKNRHTRLSRTSADPLDADRHHHSQRSSPSMYTANCLLSHPKTRPPSSDCSDTTSTTSCSSPSPSTISRSSSQKECPRSIDHGFSCIQTTSFQLPSYCRSEATKPTNNDPMFADTDLFWGEAPTAVPDLFPAHNCHPYEAAMNEFANFVASSSSPLQPLNERGQLAPESHDRSSLHAYNLPSTIVFSHTSQSQPQPDSLGNRYSYANHIQDLPSMSDIPPPVTHLPFPGLPSRTSDIYLPDGGSHYPQTHW